ncbi:MAG: phage portal protein [Pseudobutyrivibrio sp.]|nr:phage portal protein [Pseudobutyrivibrio sp.]
MAGIFDRMKLALRPTYYVSLNGDAKINVLNYSAKQLYQTQDNVKAVVDFLSHSVAQLPLKVYIRGENDSRERDRTSPAALLLRNPNPDQTAFEFFRGLAEEYYIFGNVYVWVIEDKSRPSGYQLRLIPNEWVKKTEQENAYAPDLIKVSANGANTFEVSRENFIQFKTYSPGAPGNFISPMAALRETLQEQIEASNFRKELWHSSGRLNAQVIRPKDVQPWDEATRKAWVAAFREAWGSGGSKAGSIPLMEDGMEIKPFTTSFKEQQWAESIKLSRESVAAAYRVNPSLIWHSDTQTYASSKDNARALYAECLGPDLQMIQQRINSFLLPMIGADENTYVEFDLNEKLKGSFEERASIMQSAVGGPWMTRDEARAYNNMPALPDGQGSTIIMPLNLSDGITNAPVEEVAVEQSSDAEDVEQKCSCGCHEHKSLDIQIKGLATESEQKKIQSILKAFFERQGRSVLAKINAGETEWWDSERWNKELTEDLYPEIKKIADAHGVEVANLLGTEYVTEMTEAYLQKMTEARANAINVKTQDNLVKSLEEVELYADDDSYEGVITYPKDVFDSASTKRAFTFGLSLATHTAGWSICEAGNQAKKQGTRHQVLKEWVTGPNARNSHASMNGERVEIDGTFSNGMRWPGDDVGDASETCGCNCTTAVIIS